MKLSLLTLALCITAASAQADTVVHERQHGTSTITRSVENGVATITQTWRGKKGGLFQRTTICENGTCTTNWNTTGNDGKMITGKRETIFGNRGSETNATATGPRGREWTRRVIRTR